MRTSRGLIVAALLAATPMLVFAQKPYKTGKSSYAHIVGKGTPANLSHHKDNSALVLHQNIRGGPASDLTKIEQQSARSSAGSSAKSLHARNAAMPKVGVARGERNTAINFSGHAPTHRAANIANPNGKGKSILPKSR